MNFKVTTVSLGSTKVTHLARQLANNRILLTPDCDEVGETVFRDFVWELGEVQIEVRLD